MLIQDDGLGEEGDMGVALSGGGHRATLFALGVLLYLADAGLNRQVTIISSVSGGSLTNGYVGQECDFSTVTPAEFRDVTSRLARVVALRGTLFGSWLTWLYLAGLASLTGAIVWAIYVFDGLSQLLVIAFLLLALGYGLGARGQVASAAFGRSLFSVGPRRSLLSELHGDVDHVICSTDLLAHTPFYFTKRFIYGDEYGKAAPKKVKLQTAVQASAALPGAFPPRRFRLKDLDWPAGRGQVHPYTYLVDGGVYNNLATEWIDEAGLHASANPQGLHGTPEYCVIVNASSQWPEWRRPSFWLRVPFMSEIVVVPQFIDVLYANTVNPRLLQLTLKHLNWNPDERPFPMYPMPIVLQIGSSPIPKSRGSEERLGEVLAAFTAYRPREWWQAQASRAARVPTTLNRLDRPTSRLLIHHGYTLAMAALHELSDTPMPVGVSIERVTDSLLPK